MCTILILNAIPYIVVNLYIFNSYRIKLLRIPIPGMFYGIVRKFRKHHMITVPNAMITVAEGYCNTHGYCSVPFIRNVIVA
jgi:hypothetical protein